MSTATLQSPAVTVLYSSQMVQLENISEWSCHTHWTVQMTSSGVTRCEIRASIFMTLLGIWTGHFLMSLGSTGAAASVNGSWPGLLGPELVH